MSDEQTLLTPNYSQAAPSADWLVFILRGPCHYQLSCASTSRRTVFKPSKERRTPRRVSYFSGTRWSGCRMR